MKTILITGSNRGIGLGLVRHYLKSGWQVFAASREPGKSGDLRALEKEHGDRLVSVKLDVASEQSIFDLALALNDLKLDIVINNAGVAMDENLGQWTSAAFSTCLAVNVTGPALIAQVLVPLMKPGSKLINMSSGLGSLDLNINPETGMDAYAMSKAALNMLTRRLAAKLESRGITVISISPGWVKTDMGGDEAPVLVEDSVNAMTGVFEGLTLEHSGRFFASHGEPTPW